MEKFLKDLKSTTNASKRLSRAEEAQLATQSLAGDIKSRNTLIEHNIPYAISEAKNFFRSHTTTLDLEELISASTLALMKAAQSFDPSYGVKFITYATHKIKAELHTANNTRFLVHTPGDHKRRYSQSLDQAYDKHGKLFVSETHAADQISIDDLCIFNDEKDRMLDLVRQLDTRTQDILNAYFHLDRNFDIKPADIAAKYNLSGERVRRIKNDALEFLNSQLC